MELKEETEAKARVERELREMQRKMAGMLPAPLVHEKAHIDTLRSLNEIMDRDKKQLTDQVQLLFKEKQDLINTLEDR